MDHSLITASSAGAKGEVKGAAKPHRQLQAIEQLKDIPIKILQRLGRTLENWKEEIARMWRFTKNNAIMEGLHNKRELISRRAYGFRNFENYRLRVRALCG